MSKKKPELIAAVGYLRKSTSGERKSGKGGRRRERQEKSILGAGLEMAAISGWSRAGRA